MSTLAPPLVLGAPLDGLTPTGTANTSSASAQHPSFSRTPSSALFDLMSSLPHEDDQHLEDGTSTPLSPRGSSAEVMSSPDSETDLDLADGLPSRSDSMQAGEGLSRREGVEDGDGEEGEESLAPLPSSDVVNEHSVFRSPSMDSSDLTSRLAQLSVSNLAPEGLDSVDEGGDDEKSSEGGDSTEEDSVTDEEKVEAIRESFGPYMVGEKVMDEQLLSEVKGGLFRGIVILGNIHLTNRRIVFFAVIPPAELTDAKSTSSGGVVIKSGPVLVHRPGVFKPKRRVWMELGVEMISTYPDSSPEGRTRPLKTIILSSIKKLSPVDPNDPLTCTLTIATSKADRHTRVEFDTDESALDWRRELEGALFHFKRLQLRKKESPTNGENMFGQTPEQVSSYGRMDDWEKVKISLPLDRIVKNEVADYMGFATLIALEVNNASVPTTDDLFRTASASSGSVNEHDVHHPIRLQFALLNNQKPFIDAFHKALAAARDVRSPTEVSSLPLIEMDGVFQGEYEEDKREGGDEYTAEGDPELSQMRVSSAGEEAQDELSSKLRTIFGIGNSEEMWTVPCGLQRTIIPLKGTLAISSRYIGFYRKTFGHDVKYRFLISDCVQAITSSTYHFTMSGLALQSSGHADTLFEFSSKATRDEALAKINDTIKQYHDSHDPDSKRTSSDSHREDSFSASRATSSSSIPTTATATPSNAHHHSRGDTVLVSGLNPSKNPQSFPEEAFHKLPAVVNLIPDSATGKGTLRRVLSPRHFVMLTIGSRGDIQPYIALSLGLMKDGHRCTIVTHDEFKKWIESYDIGYRQAGGDPAALMKLSVEHRMFSPGFFQESLGHFREWLDDLFKDSWNACQDADVLIESPSAMAGIHIAEALQIPYFRAFTMPWTRTHAYPQAFMVPPAGLEVSGNFNYGTYVLFDNIIWKATAGQVNRWRRKMLKLKPTDMSHLAQMSVPFIYNFSSAVVPYPIDWKDNIFISGYWNLEDSDADWSPPDDLNEFIAKAKKDEKALVYIGFGSIVVPNPNETTRNIIRAVEKADVRAIIAKGWSAKGEPEKDSEGNEVVVEFPESCYSMDKVPHGWLFNQIDAAVHHGGAGTTGASLRAGIPTVIHPFFGDQNFWAIRVDKLGVGLRVDDLEKDELAHALTKATTDKVMRKTAAKVGEKIRAEDGVSNAISWIYTHCERARDRHNPHHHLRSVSGNGSDSPTKKGALNNSRLSTIGLLGSASLKISHTLKIKSKTNLDRRTE